MRLINKQINRLSQCLIIFLVMSLAGCASTQNQLLSHSILDDILERGELRVGTTVDYKPFSYVDDSKEQGIAGLDIDLAQDLANSLGVKLTLVRTSWPTLMTDLQAQKYDIGMSGITIKLNRQKVGLFSIPMMTSGKAAIARNEDVDKYQTIEDINTKGVRLIVNPGGTNESFARANFPNATIIDNGENLTVFDKIRDGEADLMVHDAIEAIVQERIYPELTAINTDKPFNHFEFGYLMSRDHTFKAYVDQWLHKLKVTGRYDVMLETALNDVAKKHIKP